LVRPVSPDPPSGERGAFYALPDQVGNRKPVTRRPNDMEMLTGRTIRRWLPVAVVVLTVALAGCSDATPTAEVRAGDAGASTAPTSPSSTIVSSTTTILTDYHPPRGDGSDETVEPTDPGVVDPSTPDPGGDSPGGEDPPPVTGDRHPQQWDGYTVGADGRTLTFTYYAGVAPCSVFDSIEAEEGPDTVKVTIYERSGPPGVACIMLAQQKSASVTLAAPLGDRRVV
jgi:hypothetical protein